MQTIFFLHDGNNCYKKRVESKKIYTFVRCRKRDLWQIVTFKK